MFSITQLSSLAALAAMLTCAGCSDVPPTVDPANPMSERPAQFRQLETNTDKTEIDLNAVLSGGPGKDGIPAIDDPQFETIAQSDLDDEILGIFVDHNDLQRFYPLNILVWHEIVNDNFGDQPVAITFCPLCGSAIVFDRVLEGEVVRFGVSGLLYESNLLMYDDQTESLWSQALGRAVVGEYTGTELGIIPMQRITFGEVKDKHPDTQILSENTGHSRNYNVYPYGDYEESERLVFDVSVDDQRFFAKEIMYVVPTGDKSAAFQWSELPETGIVTLQVDGSPLTLSKDGGEVTATYQGQQLPGYFEMWFSWATHHQDDGVVWQP